ncbi:DNA-binding helix-turn-helix protein [Apilactobacillus kunkeei]|uniref:helix-turn-helix domain-containing protein n=1 Tax=Apilactobacillus kunkeei TaxID=148814 RepID=UPI0006DA7107|nr:helix-turn-helix transcriptional regulator [Apilactobacillus kunkeei]KPN83754.1 DNA-binding helix-turn-helix protein [Apilactobacillus kunkeei]MCK8626493.1 helix-turn-helix domain-containing protein [Apilactobacillus kunkeei]
MQFGEHIKEQRKIKNMTQEDVAKHLHVSRKTISSWENENSYPDIKSLVKISDLYQISLDTLLNEDSGLKEYLQKDKVQDNFVELKYVINALFYLAILLVATLKNYSSLFFLFGVFLLRLACDHFMKESKLLNIDYDLPFRNWNRSLPVKIFFISSFVFIFGFAGWTIYADFNNLNTNLPMIAMGISLQVMNLILYIINKFHIR